MIEGYKDFYAIQSGEPGPDSGSPLRVGGTVTFSTAGYGAHLEATEGNTGINPRMKSLDLVIDAPDDDAQVPQVITDVQLDEWTAPDGAEYDDVQFRLVGGAEGEEPPPTMRVDHPV